MLVVGCLDDPQQFDWCVHLNLGLDRGYGKTTGSQEWCIQTLVSKSYS